MLEAGASCARLLNRAVSGVFDGPPVHPTCFRRRERCTIGRPKPILLRSQNCLHFGDLRPGRAVIGNPAKVGRFILAIVAIKARFQIGRARGINHDSSQRTMSCNATRIHEKKRNCAQRLVRNAIRTSVRRKNLIKKSNKSQDSRLSIEMNPQPSTLDDLRFKISRLSPVSRKFAFKLEIREQVTSRGGGRIARKVPIIIIVISRFVAGSGEFRRR